MRTVFKYDIFVNWDMFGIGRPDYSLKLYCRCYGNYSVLAASRLPLEFGCSLCSKPHEMNSPCMFRSSQLFAGTSLTLFFRIFAASIIDSAVSILYKILFNTNNFNPHKRPILCWIMASCSQSMQRTWWPGTSTKIVTESYWRFYRDRLSIPTRPDHRTRFDPG